MALRLKVFVTSDGLTDYVVATSSRAKALALWGLRQDVFKEGGAHEVDDPDLVKAARAKPGEVLRRPTGAQGKLAALAPAKTPKPKGPTKAQLRKVADLEAELEALGPAQARAIKAIAAEQAALDRKAAALAKSQAAEREKLQDRLDAARRVLET